MLTKYLSNNVAHLLEKHSLTFGKQINYNKSSVMFTSNTSSEFRGKISQILGTPEFVLLGKYLGLPAIFGRNKY